MPNSKKKKKEEVFNKLPPQKLSLLVGEIASLLMLSKVHRKMEIRDIADIVLPPVHLNQFRIYRNSKQEPIGFVSWGWFNDETEKKYLSGDVVLKAEEWKSGDNLFFTDFIAPFGHTKKIFKDLTDNIFPDETAKTLRFDDHGKHRKEVIHLYGKDVKKKN